MSKFIIKGGKPLKGKIKPCGSKNAALPIIAATLLAKEPCVIENVPEITDVHILFEIIQKLGVKVKKIEPHKYQIDAKNIIKTELDEDLVQKLRASILLLGPVLSRKGEMKMPHPGGCIIGRRPVGTHFRALEKLGVKISQNKFLYIAKVKDKLKSNEIYLDEPSVTATENVLMAASRIPNETIIKYAACEPHIQDLGQFLIKMGAQIEGLGTNTIKVIGKEELKGANHTIILDEIEIGTFTAAAIATKGDILIKGVNQKYLDPILNKLENMNVNFKIGADFLHILPSKNLKSTRIQTAPWPGFPTDLQAPFCVVATQAKGTSLIHDWMYERRFGYIDELIKMGAKITQCDPHRILVSGPNQLYGAQIASPDIRAGIALIIAGLVAKGKTEIDNIELIERGYENIDERLRSLGADIKKIG